MSTDRFSAPVGGARHGRTGDLPPLPEPAAVPPPRQEPLFPPQTLAADTPPLMRTLLDEPTRENARRFLAWQQERLARIATVQQLLQRLSQPPAPGETDGRR